jgi:hypothetical protein
LIFTIKIKNLKRRQRRRTRRKTNKLNITRTRRRKRNRRNRKKRKNTRRNSNSGTCTTQSGIVIKHLSILQKRECPCFQRGQVCFLETEDVIKN